MVLDETGEVLVRQPRGRARCWDARGPAWVARCSASGRRIPTARRCRRPSVPRPGPWTVRPCTTWRCWSRSPTAPRGCSPCPAVPLPRDDAQRPGPGPAAVPGTPPPSTPSREELAAFAGVVAHDLRNPLAAIDGWTEMIAEELDAGELPPGAGARVRLPGALRVAPDARADPGPARPRHQQLPGRSARRGVDVAGAGRRGERRPARRGAGHAAAGSRWSPVTPCWSARCSTTWSATR